MADGKFLIGKPAGGVTTVTVADGASNTNLVLPESGTVSGVTTAVTDNAVVRFDGTTGKLQNSGVIIDDNNNVGLNTTPYSRLDLGIGSTGLNQISWHTNSTTSYGNIWTSKSGASTVIGCGLKGSSTVNDGFESSAGLGWAKSAIAVMSGFIKFYTNPIDTIPYGTAYTPTERVTINSSGDLLLTSGTGGLGYGTGAGGVVTQLTSKSTAVTLNKPTGRIITHSEALAAGATVYFVLNNSLLSVGDNLVISNSSYAAYNIECRFVTNGSAYIHITNTGGSTQSQTLAIYFSIIKGVIA